MTEASGDQVKRKKYSELILGGYGSVKEKSCLCKKLNGMQHVGDKPMRRVTPSRKKNRRLT